MRAVTLLTDDGVVSNLPCVLYSLTITTEGGGPGKVQVYDSSKADAPYRIASLLCSANQSKQFRWEGLPLDRGLYIDIVEKADYVTVEWEPVGYRKRKGSKTEYTILPAA